MLGIDTGESWGLEMPLRDRSGAANDTAANKDGGDVAIITAEEHLFKLLFDPIILFDVEVGVAVIAVDQEGVKLLWGQGKMVSVMMRATSKLCRYAPSRVRCCLCGVPDCIPLHRPAWPGRITWRSAKVLCRSRT